MKMANIDTAFDFMFTRPKKPNGVRFINSVEVMVFLSLMCAWIQFVYAELWLTLMELQVVRKNMRSSHFRNIRKPAIS